MPDPRARSGRPHWLRLPRRTARLRLTVLYAGALFLACGATVLAFTYALYSLLDRHPEFSLQEGGKEVPLSGSGQSQVRIRVSGLGQVALDKQQVLIIAGLALVVIAVASVAIGWLIAGRVLRPLRTITAAARRISASSLHERLALTGPDDELKELADTLDGLFARLEASFDAQRRFAANASHELRTPLTRERTLLQVTLADPASTTGTWQAVGRKLLASNAEQERLIEALLTLASSEVGPGEHEPADLAAITSAALAVGRPGISRLGLNVQTDIQPAVLEGDPLLIRQLAANLIDNAIRHNIPGGTSRSAPRPAVPARSCRSPTPGRSSRLPRSTACSSPSSGWPRVPPAATAVTDLACPSSAPSPPPTPPSSPRNPGPVAACPSTSCSPRRPRHSHRPAGRTPDVRPACRPATSFALHHAKPPLRRPR